MSIIDKIADERAQYEADWGVKTKLYRARSGETIHTADCKYACVPWVWAEEHESEVPFKRWLNPCKLCHPYVKRV